LAFQKLLEFGWWFSRRHLRGILRLVASIVRVYIGLGLSSISVRLRLRLRLRQRLGVRLRSYLLLIGVLLWILLNRLRE
jgi:hypothetical protein